MLVIIRGPPSCLTVNSINSFVFDVTVIAVLVMGALVYYKICLYNYIGEKKIIFGCFEMLLG